MIVINKREENLYLNLKGQIERIRKHNRQGSYQTKRRYYDANLRFAKYLSKNYGVQNYGNIKGKHIESYVENMKERGLSASTIKSDLSAIRFFNSQNSKAKNILPSNSQLNLENRKFGGVSRSWEEKEYKDFKNLCFDRKMDRIANVATLARNEGLRIHEAFRLDRSDVEKALRENILRVKGKGGKIRSLPLSESSKQMLEGAIRDIERGEKVFLEKGEATHLAIKKIQNFINRNREHFQSESRGPEEPNITFHGLRHLYAKDQYEKALEDGLNSYEARLLVSEKLGHERDDVTRIYLS